MISALTHCMLGNFTRFLSHADFFQTQLFSKKYFRHTIIVSNGLDPGQAQRCVGPGLSPNYLSKVISRQN